MTSDHQRKLTNERAADARYRDALRAKAESYRQMMYEGPASAWWTRVGLPNAPTVPPGGLLGRVALKESNEFLGVRDFYIGVRHIDQPDHGLMVFSWAAPVACAFFRDKGKHDLFDKVAVVRSFVARNDVIIDFADDIVGDPVPAEPFSTKRLTVPKPPTRHSAPANTSTPATQAPANGKMSGTRETAPQPGLDAAAPTQTQGPSLVPHIRAESALRAAIAAPRSDRLSSVLGTLQPEQYDLVTRDPERTTVIQGHPGTGKTIVAAHRAAYLVHPETEAAHRVGRVLVVGPTGHYVRHVQGVLTDLVTDGSGPAAISIHDLLVQMRRLPDRMDSSGFQDYRDVDWALGRLADDAAASLRKSGRLPDPGKPAKATVAVYEALRANSAAGHVITHDQHWAEYLTSLPPFKRAASMRRYLPLLAQCAWSAVPDHEMVVDHVIVDEAQDIAPLEWRLISKINRRDSWTLLGDMNQRRSDWTHHSWPRLAADLGIADSEGGVQLDIAGQGYRTTSAIMQFAAKLLPRADRTVRSLQTDGAPPTITKTRADDLHQTAVVEAERLLDVHLGGTVAIIGMRPGETMRLLRVRGYHMAQGKGTLWIKDSRKIWLLPADEARGLEYDGVVVVEPGDFPKNLGRHGLLYTSLTRANRELAVVHSRALPDALRRR